MIRVTVWNEFAHEQQEGHGAQITYPEGIHTYIAGFLGKEADMELKTAHLYLPEHGLTEEVLETTDVLIWWAHCKHGEVADEIVERVYQRVMRGMGLIVLHSGHHSKIFKKLMGTTGNLKWRDGARERLWTVAPNHPIAEGIPETFVLPEEEMYGEPFDIPTPEEVVFLGWFNGGEVFRSGVTYKRGLGKVFYFQPGHETYPIYHDAIIQKIIKNAVRWVNPIQIVKELTCPNTEPLENVD